MLSKRLMKDVIKEFCDRDWWNKAIKNSPGGRFNLFPICLFLNISIKVYITCGIISWTNGSYIIFSAGSIWSSSEIWSALNYNLCLSIFFRNIENALQDINLKGKGRPFWLHIAAAVASSPKSALYFIDIISV
jgi:hypothetical protein